MLHHGQLAETIGASSHNSDTNFKAGWRRNLQARRVLSVNKNCFRSNHRRRSETSEQQLQVNRMTHECAHARTGKPGDLQSVFADGTRTLGCGCKPTHRRETILDQRTDFVSVTQTHLTLQANEIGYSTNICLAPIKRLSEVL